MKIRTLLPLAVTVTAMAATALAGRPAPDVKCRVGVDRPVLPVPGDTAQTAVIKVILDGPVVPTESDRSPVNLGLVLDRSGSMSGSKIERAREAAREAVRRLTERDIVSLVVYDHEVDAVVPAQRAGLTEWIEAQINGIHARGNTALFSGVSQSAAELRKHVSEPFIHRMILLSDGLANVGPSQPADLTRLGAALVKEGISVSTIGVGTDFNEDLMTGLAQASDGNHYFIESSRDLPRIFAQELGDVLSVIATKIVVRIECPKGVRPLRVIGREAQIRGQVVEIQMNQLYGGQEKFGLLEVQVDDGRDGEVVELARVTCRYERAADQSRGSTGGRVEARFSGDMEEVRENADPVIAKNVLHNRMAEARDQALDLYKAGDHRQAAGLLQVTYEELSTMNSALGFEDNAREAGKLREDASEFAAQEIDARDSKSIRSESYRVRNQQLAY